MEKLDKKLIVLFHWSWGTTDINEYVIKIVKAYCTNTKRKLEIK